MEPTPDIVREQQSSAPSRTLQIDFTWRKWKYLITEKDDPQAKPISVVNFKFFKPHLVFTSAADGTKFGSGTIHPVSIDADCETRGRPTKIKALSRFKTRYMHQSHAFSNTDTPVPMTWTTTWDLKTWNFICLDPQQTPVAKFSANIWALKKIGYIEFLGSEADISDAAREEIVVTALTLFYCMIIRCNNILNLFGAIISKPGKVGDYMSIDSTQGTELGERVKDSSKVKVH
jgi:hypothetical protein